MFRIRWILPCLLVACAAPPAGFTSRLGSWDEAAAAHPGPDVARRLELSDDADLDELIRFASLNNAGLRAAVQRWRAALEQVPQAVSLPDPKLMLGLMVREVETRVGPMGPSIAISQAFPWFGTLEAAGGRAFELAEAERETVEAVRLDVVRRVREAYYEAAWLEAALAIANRHRELITQWEGVARSSYASGEGSQADVLRAQVELGLSVDKVQRLTELRRPLRGQLNAALGRSANTPMPPLRPVFNDPPEIDEQALLSELPQTNPALRAMARRVDAAGHGIELAEKESLPSFVLGLDYTFIDDAAMPGVSGSGDDALEVQLGLELPIYRGRVQAGIAQARARQSAARGEAADAGHRLGAELELALFELHDADRRVALYRHTLVPKGAEALRATAGSYRAGDARFVEIIDTLKTMHEFQLGVARAQSDRAQALAWVEALTGITFLGDT
jgi:outer membrane protein TolC